MACRLLVWWSRRSRLTAASSGLIGAGPEVFDRQTLARVDPRIATAHASPGARGGRPGTPNSAPWQSAASRRMCDAHPSNTAPRSVIEAPSLREGTPETRAASRGQDSGGRDARAAVGTARRPARLAPAPGRRPPTSERSSSCCEARAFEYDRCYLKLASLSRCGRPGVAGQFEREGVRGRDSLAIS